MFTFTLINSIFIIITMYVLLYNVIHWLTSKKGQTRGVYQIKQELQSESLSSKIWKALNAITENNYTEINVPKCIEFLTLVNLYCFKISGLL